jgi:hypothetical protein
MAACPQCRRELRLNQLSAKFACPNCGTALRSNFPKLLWWVIPLAILAEAALYFGVYESTKDGALIAVVFFSVGGLTAFLVYWALSALLSQAELDETGNGESAI